MPSKRKAAAVVLPKIVKRRFKAPPRKSRAKAVAAPPARGAVIRNTHPAPLKVVLGSTAKEKQPIGLPDPLEAALEAQRLAQEGNVKLARSVDALRTACETVLIAEVDNTTGRAVTVQDLRGIVTAGLNEYSRITGQSWKRHKLIGNWAGGTGNKPVHESDMA